MQRPLKVNNSWDVQVTIEGKVTERKRFATPKEANEYAQKKHAELMKTMPKADFDVKAYPDR
jgi:hypothetical protein